MGKQAEQTQSSIWSSFKNPFENLVQSFSGKFGSKFSGKNESSEENVLEKNLEQPPAQEREQIIEDRSVNQNNQKTVGEEYPARPISNPPIFDFMPQRRSE